MKFYHPFLSALTLVSLSACSSESGPGGDSGGESNASCAPTCGAGTVCVDGQCVSGSPGSGGGSSSGGSGPGPSPSGGATSSGGAGSGGTSGGEVVLTGVETPTPPCELSSPPAYAALPTNARLPDPFEMLDGSRVTTQEQWACRRAEILSHIAEYELGPKPPKPSSVTGSLSGSTLTIQVSEGGKSTSFTVNVSKPAGAGPFPAIIAYGAASIPVPAGVATITYSNDSVAAQQGGGSRGQGKFYELYGSDHGAGALMAWAWGVSRIIDVLEATPSIGIDAERVGVTGCSRNGKGAIVAGAYDARVALTIPQESGSGGSACWRVSDHQKSQGQNVQTLSQITGENVWFRSSFNQFGNTASKLPFDHHMLAGLVAPRGLLVIENTSMEWLGNVSCFACSTAGREIFEALGVTENMGFSQVGHGNHCTFPASQRPELEAYIGKFLLGQDTNADVFKTDGGFTFDAARWVDWETPLLE